jgi:hypothetical protein
MKSFTPPNSFKEKEKISSIFIAMKIYKIKSEDKAAFLNRLEKMGVKTDTTQIRDRAKLVDGQVVKYFEITVMEPNDIQTVDAILKDSPGIDLINSHKAVHESLRIMIREELKNRGFKRK